MMSGKEDPAGVSGAFICARIGQNAARIWHARHNASFFIQKSSQGKILRIVRSDDMQLADLVVENTDQERDSALLRQV